ncbi:hypothetical protein ACWDQO_17160 [Streptomyces sp. NPDC003703]
MHIRTVLFASGPGLGLRPCLQRSVRKNIGMSVQSTWHLSLPTPIRQWEAAVELPHPQRRPDRNRSALEQRA